MARTQSELFACFTETTRTCENLQNQFRAFLGLPSKSVWLSGEVSCMDYEMQKLSQATDVVCRACSHSNWMSQARRFLDLIQLRERFLLRLGRPPVTLTCTLLPRVLFSNISCNHASKTTSTCFDRVVATFDMLKCQHKGLPASVFLFKPDDSSGNWGFSPGWFALWAFGSWCRLPSITFKRSFWAEHSTEAWLSRAHLSMGRASISQTNHPEAVPHQPVLSKSPWSQKQELKTFPGLLSWLASKWLHWSSMASLKQRRHEFVKPFLTHGPWEKPTMSNAKCRLCSAKYNLSSVLVSKSCKPDTIVCFNAPCSSVIIVFDLFFDSVCTSFSLEWHLLGCTYTMFPLSTML